MKSESLVIDHPHYRMRFVRIGTRVEWTGFRDADGHNWLVSSEISDVLWRAGFRALDGTSPVYDSNLATFEGFSSLAAESGLPSHRLSWSLPLSPNGKCAVHIDITADPDVAVSLWRLSVEVPGGWQWISLDFPVLPNLSGDDGMVFIAPSGWGVSHPLKPGFAFEGDYPSWQAGLQMMALHHPDLGKGVYFGAHDSDGQIKTLRCRRSGNRVSCSIGQTLPRDSHAGGSRATPWQAAVGFYQGDYRGAARIYRDFSFRTPWGRKETPAWLERVPTWFKETDLWLRPDGAPEENLDVTLEALAYFGVSTGLHWYRWHRIPYDTLYPDYLPPKEGFGEAVAAFRRAGARVICYINGRLSDPASHFWRKENGAASAARKENGDCYTEIYGSKVPNNVMCPHSGAWQKKIVELVRALVREYGLDGVYIDQVAAGAGVPCHDGNHGHAPGGGSFWREGYLRLLELCRGQMPGESILTTEENAECWLNRFDGHLTVNTPLAGCRPLPLFPAVYSDRSLCIGTYYYAPDEPENALPFRYKNAWAFLWGAQPGWIQPQRIMRPEVAGEARFLKRLVQVRKYARPFMVGGRFLGMVKVEGDNPVQHVTASGPFGGTYRFDEDAVLASLWRSPEGRHALLVCNVDEESRHVGIQSPSAVASGQLAVHDAGGRREMLDFGRDIHFAIEGSQSLVLNFQEG